MSDDQGAPMDYKAHFKTWEGVKTLLTVGTVAAALTGLLVIFLIAPKA